jgi:hypothetical protein
MGYCPDSLLILYSAMSQPPALPKLNSTRYRTDVSCRRSWSGLSINLGGYLGTRDMLVSLLVLFMIHSETVYREDRLAPRSIQHRHPSPERSPIIWIRIGEEYLLHGDSVQGLCFVMPICRPVEQYFELCEVSISHWSSGSGLASRKPCTEYVPVWNFDLDPDSLLKCLSNLHSCYRRNDCRSWHTRRLANTVPFLG